MSLGYAMEQITGVDGRYTGRDTGSIITTGGTEEMLNRVTLIDSPKILMYEAYTKRLTQLVLGNLLEYAPKRDYFYREPNTTKWTTLTVDFPNIKAKTLFQYEISISSELPKNKQRIATMANMLMEKQMQYQQQGSTVNLITEEEWLMMQDLPNKEYMLERMGIERGTDALKETSQVLFEYAKLVEGRYGSEPSDVSYSRGTPTTAFRSSATTWSTRYDDPRCTNESAYGIGRGENLCHSQQLEL